MRYRYCYVGKIIPVNQWVAMSRGKIYERKEYKKFKQDLALLFRGSGNFYLTQRFNINIYVKLWKVKDTDGVIKPVLDALEMSGKIKNDNLVKDIYVKRGYHEKQEDDTLVVEIITGE